MYYIFESINIISMTLRKLLPLLFVLSFNLWLSKIFAYNIFIALVTVVASIFIYLTETGSDGNRRCVYVCAVFIFILIFFQYKTSSINSLVFLNENEKIEQQQRMRGYPRELYRFANWLEQRKEALIFYKVEENFSEVVDPNIYFFANHPRERVGVVEYEKFPYILLPFFVFGILSVKKIPTLFLSASPIILLSLIGNSNPMGPFSIFPLLSVYTAKGLQPIFGNTKYLWVFIVVFSLVFIQTISYATH